MHLLSHRRARRTEPVCTAARILTLGYGAFLAVIAGSAVATAAGARQTARATVPAHGTLALNACKFIHNYVRYNYSQVGLFVKEFMKSIYGGTTGLKNARKLSFNAPSERQ